VRVPGVKGRGTLADHAGTTDAGKRDAGEAKKECGRTTWAESKKGDGPRQTKIKVPQNEKGTPKQTKSGDWPENENWAKTRSEEIKIADDDWPG
jgi:hypothetical protein